MIRKMNSFVRLELALSETQLALRELIEVLRGTSTSAPPPHCPNLSGNSNKIIPYYASEAYREIYQRGRQLDQRYKELWLKEHKIKSEYLDPDNADKHDTLLAQLESVQQEMTEILQEFDPPESEDEGA